MTWSVMVEAPVEDFLEPVLVPEELGRFEPVFVPLEVEEEVVAAPTLLLVVTIVEADEDELVEEAAADEAVAIVLAAATAAVLETGTPVT